MNIRDGKIWIPFIMICSLLLSACTAGTANVGKKETDSESSGKTDTSSIVIGLATEPTTLMGSTDPVASTSGIIQNIYSQLLDYDGKGDFIPKLATEWKNIDEFTWEFKLREGVKFHNGAPFNAESVKYTVDYMINPENKSVYGSRWMKVLKEVKIIDEHTIQFITNRPMANFLTVAFTDFHPLEPGYVEQVGKEEASKKPIGTGPYKVKEWKRGEYVTFEAFDDFWGGKPEIKNVTIKVIPEFSSRLSALLSGDVDLIKSVPVDSVERVKADSNSKIISALTGKNAFIALNTFHEGPIQDVRVRKALNHAIDVDSLLKNVMNGKGEKLTSTLTPFNISYTEVDGYDYNPEKAKKLIQEAGFKPEDIQLTLETTNGYFPMDSQIAQAIAGELGKIGIKVTVEQVETGVYIQRATSQKMKDMYFFNSAASVEGENFYSFYFSPAGVYRFHNNPELLEGIQKSFSIFNQEERQKEMATIQNRLRDEAVTIPLWMTEDIWGARKDIEFKPRFNETLEFFEIKRGQ
ncbi:ABC transporter substrate-binding protein [Bacillus sp. FJAT-29814]|uniref:ABC transporter substrate-binding protein n=1 Tax=Bacillus sp. FJAT-29814 TaxID=1729688 RepID=UPI00082F93D5|nr:ABC transporter substrate-binding protein [Bacillus sp. FJAT-29814]